MRLGKSLLVIGAFGLAGFGLTAAPANAAGTCAAGSVCMWEDPDYSGSLYVNQPGNEDSYDIHWWNGDNEISSVINNTGKCVRLYDNDNWTGTSYFIEKDGSRANLQHNGYDNKAESYKIYSC